MLGHFLPTQVKKEPTEVKAEPGKDITCLSTVIICTTKSTIIYYTGGDTLPIDEPWFDPASEVTPSTEMVEMKPTSLQPTGRSVVTIHASYIEHG